MTDIYNYWKNTSCSYGTGTFCTTDVSQGGVENLIKFCRKYIAINNISPEYENQLSTRCFDPFWKFFLRNPSNKLTVCHMGYPVWYRKVIDEFNEIFSNIRIGIVEEIPMFMGVTINSHYYNSLDYSFNKLDNGIPIIRAVLSIELINEFVDMRNDSDGWGIKRRVFYLIHHFLRMLSYSEIFYMNIYDEDPGWNYLEFVLELSNRVLKEKDAYLKRYKNSNYSDLYYRSLSENIVSLDTFLRLDDLKYICEIFCKNVGIIYKQTILLDALNPQGSKKTSGYFRSGSYIFKIQGITTFPRSYLCEYIYRINPYNKKLPIELTSTLGLTEFRALDSYKIYENLDDLLDKVREEVAEIIKQMEIRERRRNLRNLGKIEREIELIKELYGDVDKFYIYYSNIGIIEDGNFIMISDNYRGSRILSPDKAYKLPITRTNRERILEITLEQWEQERRKRYYIPLDFKRKKEVKKNSLEDKKRRLGME